ncbi:AAA family ATPase [Streptomyces sp. NPDC058691]|uniref:AAA family ATPase n=1 Tax=Streptomyces sp. NPDC058691 TaxID=3346601 RepID=UPI00364CD069
MEQPTDDADGLVLAIVVDEYPDGPPGKQRLEYLAAGATTFLEAVEGLGFRAAPVVLPKERTTRTGILEAIADLRDQPHRRKIVYWAGHGLKEKAHSFRLLCRDSYQYKHRPGIAVEELAEAVLELSGNVLLIIDACYSGAARRDITEVAHKIRSQRPDHSSRPSGFAVVVTAAEDQEAAEAEWGRHLRAIVTDPRTSVDNDPIFKPSAPGVPLTDLMDAVAARMGNKHIPQRPDYAVASALSRDFFRNPYRKAGVLRQALRPENDTIWLDGELRREPFGPALGRSPDWAARHFTGRVHSLRRIVTWLGSHQEGLLAVTGPAGSGKSTLLSYLANLTIPDFCRELPAEASAHPRPDHHSIHAAVHCRNSTLPHLMADLCIRLRPSGLEPPAGGYTTTHAFIDAVEALAAEKGMLTLLFDGLDEAAPGQSLDIARDLLQDLATRAGIKVVVGTRRRDRRPTGDEVAPETLLDVLQRAASVDPVALDQDPDTLEDIRRYAEKVLRDPADSPYRHPENAELLQATARHIAERSDKLFLVASVYARSLARDGRLLPPERLDSGMRSGIAELHELLGEQLAALDTRRPERVRDLLRPLALAQGAGLPFPDIWLTMANALRSDPYEGPYTQAELNTVRERTLGAFIVRDRESGQDVYRFQHQSFGSHLLPVQDEQAVLHARIHTALVQLATEGASQDWASCDPYIKNHLASHAAAAGDGVLEDLMMDIDFLVHAEPSGIVPFVHARIGLVDEPALYLRVASEFGRRSSAERRALLRAAALRSHPQLMSAVGREHPDLVWQDVWTDSVPEPAHRAWPSPHGGAHAVAWTDGANELIAACGVGEVRAWDASTGRVAWVLDTAASRRHARSLHSVGVVDDSYGTLVFAADMDAIHVWSGPELQHIQRLFWGGHPDTVTAAVLNGVAYVAALDEGTLWVWSRPPKRTHLSRLHHVPVGDSARSLALVPVGERLVAVVGGRSEISLWDVTKSRNGQRTVLAREFGHLRMAEPSGSGSVIVAALPDTRGSAAAWVAGADGKALKIWHLTDVELDPLRIPRLPLSVPARVVTLGHSPDGPLLAAAAHGSIRIWNLKGTEYAPLDGHSDAVRSLTFDPSGSGRVAVAAGARVRVWDPAEPFTASLGSSQAWEPTGRTPGLLHVAQGHDGKHLLLRALGTTLQISLHSASGFYGTRNDTSNVRVLPSPATAVTAHQLHRNRWLVCVVNVVASQRVLTIYELCLMPSNTWEASPPHTLPIPGAPDKGTIRSVTASIQAGSVRLFVADPGEQQVHAWERGLNAPADAWRPIHGHPWGLSGVAAERVATTALSDGTTLLAATGATRAEVWPLADEEERFPNGLGRARTQPQASPSVSRGTYVPAHDRQSLITAMAFSVSGGQRCMLALATAQTVGVASWSLVGGPDDCVSEHRPDLLRDPLPGIRSMSLTGPAERPLLIACTGVPDRPVRIWDVRRRIRYCDIPNRGYTVEEVAAAADDAGIILFLSGQGRCDQLLLPAQRLARDLAEPVRLFRYRPNRFRGE